MSLRPFHLAFPVRNLKEARAFYGTLLGCEEGRSSEEWVDFNFFGHQIVAHQNSTLTQPIDHNIVDGERVPVRHFGIVLTMGMWKALVQRLEQAKKTFLIAPDVRFAGQPGEQATFFIEDPSGNVLEFKAFADDNRIFAR